MKSRIEMDWLCDEFMNFILDTEKVTESRFDDMVTSLYGFNRYILKQVAELMNFRELKEEGVI